ncbi:MAG: NUDIX hydrolase, partial [Pseudomonadota bacterium]|nr:NUDIX hydrolase [Pseudomonadota bacterium]
MKKEKFFKKWTKYIVEGKIDSDKVAKIVLYNDKNEVLFLKRTDYVEKFKNEWDLPGGHAHIGEDMIKALRREVREETKLSFKKPIKIKKIGNITFFKAKYDGGEIKL